MDLVQTNGMTMAVAEELVDTGNLLDAAKIMLFTNDVMPVATSVTADFTSAAYGGYNDATITWAAPSIADDGTIEVIGTLAEFRPTDDATPETVFGAVLLTGTGDMLMGGRFDGAPLPMQVETDSIFITVRFRPADQSFAIVIS